jgi:hypothetical protein
VARRYYLQEQSKVDIAALLGISRFKVARLLDEARSTGLVRIEIVNRWGGRGPQGRRRLRPPGRGERKAKERPAAARAVP